jgi:hypothetical protein
VTKQRFTQIVLGSSYTGYGVLATNQTEGREGNVEKEGFYTAEDKPNA